MSNVAARQLLDKITPLIDRVFVLHDFDISGFSIFGTLGTDGRRYTFENKPNVVDLGLRLTDVREMDLQSEPVEVKDDTGALAKTLDEHGATKAEIDFLLGLDGKGTKRVELNAMDSRQFLNFLETKLVEHGVAKVVPDAATLKMHARRLIEQTLADKALKRLRPELAKQATAAECELTWRAVSAKCSPSARSYHGKPL